MHRLLHSITMAAKVTVETLKRNAALTRKSLDALKQELCVLKHDYSSVRAQHLREENARLMKAVEDAKRALTQIEMDKGIRQIDVPNQPFVNLAADVGSDTNHKQSAAKFKVNITDEVLNDARQLDVRISEAENFQKGHVGDAFVKKEKKVKAPKENVTELPVDVGRLDLRVAKVEDVQKHPDADTLYVLKVNCGEEKPRNVCSGLVKHVAIEELRDRLVVLLCNLKPVKMRGITSEAMVMCASTSESVEVLSPPADAQPGDLVCCEGFTRQPDSVMNPKKKIFETVAPDLHTDGDLQACYKGVPWSVTGKGKVLSRTLKNVAVK